MDSRPPDDEPAPKTGGAPVLSAFSPIEFTFGLLEKDLLGVLGPLVVAGALSTLDWTLLELGFATSWPTALGLLALWVPLGSIFARGMLSFTLKAARSARYGFRDLWQLDRSVLELMGLKLMFYAALGASVALVQVASSLGDSHAPEDKAIRFLLLALLLLGWLFLLIRTLLAPVLVVDSRLGCLRALWLSVSLTRGNARAIGIYLLLLLMIAGMAQTILPAALVTALGAPGLVYLGLALQGDPAV